MNVVFTQGKENSSLTQSIEMKIGLRWATDGPKFSESYVALGKKSSKVSEPIITGVEFITCFDMIDFETRY